MSIKLMNASFATFYWYLVPAHSKKQQLNNNLNMCQYSKIIYESMVYVCTYHCICFAVKCHNITISLKSSKQKRKYNHLEASSNT